MKENIPHGNEIHEQISDIRNTFSLKSTWLYFFIFPFLIVGFFYSDIFQSYKENKLYEECVLEKNYESCRLYEFRFKKQEKFYIRIDKVLESIKLINDQKYLKK